MQKKNHHKTQNCTCCNGHKENPKKGVSLDTLAQLGKMGQNGGFSEGENEDFPELDKGTTIDDKKTLIKRAKRKYIASNMAVGLVMMSEAKTQLKLEGLKRQTKRIKKRLPIYTATPDDSQAIKPNAKVLDYFTVQNEDKDILRSYWNMYHCNKEITKTAGGKVSGRYCKNRLCLVCNSIRTAELIEKYKPVMQAWKDDMYMVTLTIENPTAKMLKPSIEEMQKCFTKVKDQLKKEYQKDLKDNSIPLDSKFPKFEGLRKLECTSLRENNYHPHFHILVKGERCAKELRKRWVDVVEKSEIISCQLKGKDKKGNIVYLQDVQKANNGVGNELFKYFTKILSRREKKGERRNVYLNRLDTIFKAMRGKRVFQTFGFKISDYKEAAPEIKTDEVQLSDDVFGMPIYDLQRERINEYYFDFYKSGMDEQAQEVLIWNLYTVQRDFVQAFKDFYPKLSTRERLEQILENFERSKRTPEDIDILQDAIKEIDPKLYVHLDETEEAEQIEDTPPDEVFIYNDKTAQWHSEVDNRPLFEFRVSQALKDIINSFKYPRKYRDTIIDLYFQKNRQNEKS